MMLELALRDAGPPPAQDEARLAEEVRSMLRLLRPHRVEGRQKIRLGNPGDGGYVCLDDFRGLDTAFSFGIDHNVSWDCDVADRGLTVLQYDHTVDAPRPDDARMRFHKKMISTSSGEHSESLDALIRRHDKQRSHPNILLKIDIENAEWEVFSHIDPGLLGRISQITGEFHAFEWLWYPEWRARTQKAIQAIAENFALVHVHGNNFAAVTTIGDLQVPNVMELTFVNRALHRLEPSDEVFPGPLDQPCNTNAPDIQLGDFRF